MGTHFWGLLIPPDGQRMINLIDAGGAGAITARELEGCTAALK
ncbi:MAG: hypothetical protein ACLRXC_06325 [[Clostridium] leptum]